MSDIATDAHADLIRAEAAYWRARAEHAEAKLMQAAVDLTEARRSIGRHMPPEPPVGTTLHHLDGVIVWTRGEDGWHCGRTDGPCRNCPCDWFEVVEQGGLNYERKLP